jgi:hypothetical protein
MDIVVSLLMSTVVIVCYPNKLLFITDINKTVFLGSFIYRKITFMILYYQKIYKLLKWVFLNIYFKGDGAVIRTHYRG